MSGNYERMLDLYPLLIESAIDFKIESRKILAAHNGKSCFTFYFFDRKWPIFVFAADSVVFDQQLLSVPS